MKLDIYPVGYYMVYNKQKKSIASVIYIAHVDGCIEEDTTSDSVHYTGYIWNIDTRNWGMRHIAPASRISRILQMCSADAKDTLSLIPIGRHTAGFLITFNRTVLWNQCRSINPNWLKSNMDDRKVFLGEYPDSCYDILSGTFFDSEKKTLR